MFPLSSFLTKFVKTGALSVIDANGVEHHFGEASPSGPRLTVALRRRSLYWTLVLNPDLYLGEAFMRGDLEIIHGSLAALLELCGRNMALKRQHHPWLSPVFRLIKVWSQHNSRRKSRRNVAHHYDLSPELYRSFLDRDWQYSCAYFTSPQMSLDDAQTAKRRHLAAKLLLTRNQRVLDIGCGWGGLALDLARHEHVRVDGISLSTEQIAAAKRRAAASRQSDSVRFLLADYRDIKGQYDRIVSVGMFEHVGVPNYAPYFDRIASLLTPDGVAVVHSIGSSDGPGLGNAWIEKYIFPGGYIPSLSEVLPVIERSGLVVTDIEILRLHYAETLKHWRQRFIANWPTIAHLYDETFRRMWEFYLVSCEMAFRFGGLMVFQVQLAKDQGAVPLTRDYISAYEAGRDAEDESVSECAA